ncbi:disease resistance protein Roq1-like [Rutidosis leptorrhynchoides]|uniref:disease resistance protein Roq1-like n=1 Tax=Rutidosis leptorrhynchoides TaxID=125765 RepID=UPI003A9922B4
MDDQVDRIMEVKSERTTDSTKCCSLSNIGDMKIESLQNQLISDVLGKKRQTINDINEGKRMIKDLLSSKKVILLLDDVDQKTKLDALVGMGKCWFGSGSKVIITTRNKEVLKDVELKHELTGMDFDHSLQLFSRHAFRSDHPPADYVPLSKKAVKVCGHLPLALEIVGSFLAGKDRKSWETTLEKLEIIPDENVEEKLNISINALQPHAKEIFLDICCFFIGFDAKIVRHMWKSCGFLPDYYLDVLQQMSLIKIIERDRLWMHNLLRDIGRHFVRRIGTFRPEKQSRVWDEEQANDILMAKGIENIEAICLKFDHQSQRFLKKDELAILSNLRFLQVDCGDLDLKNVQHFSLTNRFQRNLSNLPKLRWLSWHKFVQRCPSTKRPIFPNLRYLSWHEFPIFFQLTTFSLMKIVILDLSQSQITNDWKGWNHLKTAKNLKVLNLTKCINLRKTPNVSAHENLEQLILQGCEELVQVDRSIGKLKQLVFLNLGGCRKLHTLPDEMEGLEALTELLLDGTSITKIPAWKGMKKLVILSASSCGLLSECNLAGCSTSLLYLDLPKTRVSQLPFGNFGSLVELNLSRSRIRELPNSIETMKNLRVLRISGTNLKKLPSTLGMLEKLEEIDAYDCESLCGEIPSEIGRLSFLRILRLTKTRISDIPKLPESMTNLYLSHNKQMSCPDLSNLSNLRNLTLDLKYRMSSHLAPSLKWIGGLRKLETLWLCCDGLFTVPSDFNLLLKLRQLKLFVNNLECLPKLPQNLSFFDIYGLGLMEKSINLSYLEKLLGLHVYNCRQLMEIQGLQHLKNLRGLRLVRLLSLVKLLDLTGLKKLRELYIEDCPKVVEVRGQLESLDFLHLNRCEMLEKLPDPLSFKHIKVLRINSCGKLKEIQGLEYSENLTVLLVSNLPMLEKLLDLTNANELKDLQLRNCCNLIEIRGRLESLERLFIKSCGSLRKVS